MRQHVFAVPTYQGNTEEHRRGDLPEWSESNVNMLVHEVEGLRVVLGSDQRDAGDKPSIQVERRPGGWAIFIAPDCGDVSAYVYVLDDGRTLVSTDRHADGEHLGDGCEIPKELDTLPTVAQ